MKLLVSAFLLSSASLLGFADNHELTPKLVLNKCCRFDQRLDISEETNDYVCVDNGNDVRLNGSSWIPREVFQNSTTFLLSDIVTNENTMPNCESGVRDQVFRNKFDLIVKDNEIVVGVNNSNENYFVYPSSEFCLDQFETESKYLLLLCPCNAKTCVKKCCYDNEEFDLEESMCVNVTNTTRAWHPLVDQNGVTSRYVLYGKYPTCPFGSIVPSEFDRLEGKSQLKYFSGNHLKDLSDARNEFTSMDGYCVDNILHRDAQIVLHCAENDMEMTETYGWLFLLGAAALFLTVLLTIFLPVMRKNVYGKMAFCHNISLFFGSLFTGLSNVMHSTLSPTSCIVFSFIIQFTFLATFFWLNVMCIDMSLVFG